MEKEKKRSVSKREEVVSRDFLNGREKGPYRIKIDFPKDQFIC